MKNQLVKSQQIKTFKPKISILIFPFSRSSMVKGVPPGVSSMTMACESSFWIIFSELGCSNLLSCTIRRWGFFGDPSSAMHWILFTWEQKWVFYKRRREKVYKCGDSICYYVFTNLILLIKKKIFFCYSAKDINY